MLQFIQKRKENLTNFLHMVGGEGGLAFVEFSTKSTQIIFETFPKHEAMMTTFPGMSFMLGDHGIILVQRVAFQKSCGKKKACSVVFVILPVLHLALVSSGCWWVGGCSV